MQTAGTPEALQHLLDKREVLVQDTHDVIIVGGGVAGVGAAVGAAREGAKVLLIEKSVVLGGLATIGLINWYEPLCDGAGTKLIGGIAEELLKLSIRYGFDNLADEWRDQRNGVGTRKRYATLFSPMLFAMALDEYLSDHGVRIRLDSLATYPAMNGKRCQGVIVESVSGREFFPAEVVIDSTGDASILHRAGMPTALGENYLSYVAHGTSYELARKFVENRNMSQFRPWFSVGSDMNGRGHPQDLPPFHGDSAEAVTSFVLAGRKVLFDKLKADDRNSRDVTMLPTMPQFRKIRRLVGEYQFTGQELNVKFPDAIGAAGDFRARDRRFQIPYGCLYHRDFPNLLAAGRIVSASEDGWEITRVIPVAVMTGEAAGIAAAMSARSGTSVAQVNLPDLQRKLAASGVLFI
jgi:hypothetical protein